MSEPVYPIIDIYPTIQAEGNLAGGEPIILVRLGTPPGWHHAHISSLRPTKSYRTPLSDLLNQIPTKWPFINTVHLTGDDPCLSPIVPLIDGLLDRSLRVSIGTCGAFLLPERLLGRQVLDVTLSPKPGIPLHREMLDAATEIRLYVKKGDVQDEEFAELRTSLKVRYKHKLLYVPFTMDIETIHRTITEVQTDGTKFHLPLYRLMPDFDKAYQTAPDAAEVFTLQDRQEGNPHPA